MSAATAEKIRLVIWDLDETFWDGTLTEGGMRYRRDIHDIVVELAQRGVVSSICSKNDMATVREILEREGIWEYFVFPSINWDAKGPRLAALVETAQLRAPTVLFIDDNPMNRGEAQHYVPGIQVADETIIPQLLESGTLASKEDRALTRLNQYKLLERRKADEAQIAVAAGGDNTAFLRESEIVVSIEHDLEAHLDRAIEMINRTNQLNFTKVRLSENIEEARKELRELLSGHTIQAGILRVRDRYGDYGYCGLYVMSSGQGGFKMRHFCFSCRILNMGVESWLYQRLGRPKMIQQGEVLTDVVRDKRTIDWISVEVPETLSSTAKAASMLDYVYARGGCDLAAVTHYFKMVADEVYGEFNTVENGRNLPLHHSVFARHTLKGIGPVARRLFGELGYNDEHFRTVIPDLPKGARAVWLLSFWSEAAYSLYRHNGSGASIPVALATFKKALQDITELDISVTGADPALIDLLKSKFTFTGMVSEAEFKNNVRLLLSHVTPGTAVFILKSNVDTIIKGNQIGVSPKKTLVNRWLDELAAELPMINLLDINTFVGEGEATGNPNHFDRRVYFRIYQHILKHVQMGALEAAAAE